MQQCSCQRNLLCHIWTHPLIHNNLDFYVLTTRGSICEYFYSGHGPINKILFMAQVAIALQIMFLLRYLASSDPWQFGFFFTARASSWVPYCHSAKSNTLYFIYRLSFSLRSWPHKQMIPLSWVGLGVPCRGLTAFWKRIFNRFWGIWRHSKCQLGCCDMCKVMKPNTLVRTLVVKSLRHTVPSHAGLFNGVLLTFHNP